MAAILRAGPFPDPSQGAGRSWEGPGRTLPGMPRFSPTLVIGAGQAGLSLSRYLTEAGHDHVVLDRGRVGERWWSERWPGLRLLTPNWLNVLPGAPAPADPEGFQPARVWAAGLADYARSFGAPVHERQAVRRVRPAPGGYLVETQRDAWHAGQVVVATGDCDRPRLPAVSGAAPPGLRALHASAYTTPDALPRGAVLVVGAGPSGQQLALELAHAGRRVVLAVGGHGRMLRRYRGRDAFAWMAAMGQLHQDVDDLDDPARARRGRVHVLSGHGDLDLGILRRAGVELAGRLVGFDGTSARFGRDLRATAAEADARLARLLDRIDAFAGGPAPAVRFAPLDCDDGPGAVDLRGFGAIVWATGYGRAYPWLRAGVLDGCGEIVHRRGATPRAGLHVLGLRFQSRRSSHLIGGVGRDAAELAAVLTAEAGARRAA
jgi:putative flavoprotein involved in K+ transport